MERHGALPGVLGLSLGYYILKALYGATDRRCREAIECWDRAGEEISPPKWKKIQANLNRLH